MTRLSEQNHLDIEQPLFANKPHIWIQWKGTDVCCDVHCECGEMSHYDGDFMYFIKCPACGLIWEVGTHVTLHKAGYIRPDDGRVKQAEL